MQSLLNLQILIVYKYLIFQYLNDLSKSISIQYAKYKIRSNSILPGPIDTPMQKRWKINPLAKKNLSKNIPLQRIGLPKDIANASIFLLSDQSEFITGIELIVDGGLTARP